MPEITIKNLQSKTIHCPAKSEKLIDILLEETDWMHACGQKGRCTTCTAIILDGMDNLGTLSDAEKRFIKLEKLKPNERLACQATVQGDVTVSVPQMYQLPHISYSE